jgi:hypothetical protein
MRRIVVALGHGAKTLQEIERAETFLGPTVRARQQRVCSNLYRLIDRGLVEKTSRKRVDGSDQLPCGIYRLTWKGEMLWRSG